MAPIRVVIADDHPVVRSGIRNLLEREPEIFVVGEADGGEAALELARSQKPDVLLLDMEMPGMKGYEVAQRIRDECLPVAVLVLSAYDDREYIHNLLSLGVGGYLVKEEAPEAIVEAVRQVARGEQGWVSRRVMARMSTWIQTPDRPVYKLTPREQQVLERVVAGETNVEIARGLQISTKTVEKHLVMVFEKLGVSSRVEAAVLALREGLVE